MKSPITKIKVGAITIPTLSVGDEVRELSRKRDLVQVLTSNNMRLWIPAECVDGVKCG